ncbi:TetR/AcrR family transcriptional regulator [Lapillicoccus jejuensis]|uniref:TetR family transcriptional regulator n=1 Tax=Lapillicoccus jejuensis TaxID=402171 RepID=A0A542E563_9MICO|nr:TetR family transcriptional regulator [Lapillicoccus jejuensis]TQJ10482.1 TetR family transcriptional regulator [Lapillicoccus jejuensis]
MSSAPAPDGRSTRWAQHRLERRRELVEATLRAIRRHGAGVGMDEVALAAGTSKTVVYRHFTDKAGLYHAVAERVDEIILRDLGRALGEAGVPLTDLAADPRHLVATAVDAYLSLVEKDPEVYRFIVAAPLLERGTGSGAGADPAASVSDHVAEQLAALFAEALAATGSDTAAAPVWARGVVGMVRAAADAWLAGQPGFAGLPRRALTEHLATLAWTGLATTWPADAR